MTEPWLMVILVGAATAAIKASGPVILGGRRMPTAVVPVLSLLAPSLFGALVATQTFAAGQRLAVDERLAGLIVAAAGAVVGCWPAGGFCAPPVCAGELQAASNIAATSTQ